MFVKAIKHELSTMHGQQHTFSNFEEQLLKQPKPDEPEETSNMWRSNPRPHSYTTSAITTNLSYVNKTIPTTWCEILADETDGWYTVWDIHVDCNIRHIAVFINAFGHYINTWHLDLGILR